MTSSEPTPVLAAETLGLGTGFAANKAVPTDELAGLRLSLTDGDRTTEYVFDSATELRWRSGGDGDRYHAETYEALKPAVGLYVVGFSSSEDSSSAVELAIDVTHGRALVLHQRLEATAPGVPSVVQVTELPSVTGGPAGTTTAEFEPIGRSSDLNGVRALWEYSADDVYEHIYLNDEWYVWHCLAGEEYPLADTDPCRVYKLRDGIYALTFSEKVLSMGALMVLDFDGLRSYCAAFGSESDGNRPSHFLFGAYGRILSRTVYPQPLSAREGGAAA
ncbi:MoaF C-terminal domain-containing protein [Leifsonia shinshuensis]|uniref:Molybdenum cofactor biosynthesis protein MoaF n=1 Tax=Leifsonia shinshuensis TaxID=150026 RepID=A0A7G6YA90_9MICO|nr:MoaF C-terminal domain-containing protein [Leifsonia shinshuensis]QNE35405.1 molybdenum cofactor biosynthesis protein MoaF [Leifsonia shinshuensis]